MTKEEKAKAYDEALNKLRRYIAQGVDPLITRADVQDFFPELKESEDERIRRDIIRYLKKTSPAIGENIEKMLAWLEKQGEPQDKGEISDGYHTFNELYYYRMLYNAAFFNLLPKEWVHKSKRHHDGEECFGGGWFIVMANLPTGQISNHYELNDWDLFQIPEKEIADEWDNHTPQQAAERLYRYLLEKQGFQKPTDEEMKELLRTEYEKGRADAIAEMQKPVDKVEPKFKVGDYVKNVNDKREPIYEIVYMDKECYMCEYRGKENIGDKAVMHFAFDYPYLRHTQKPAWSEEDKKIWEEVSNILWEGYKQSCSKFTWDDIRDWVKPKIESFKDRVQPKQEWSKEDESIALGIEQIVNCASLLNIAPDKLDKVRDWLKSLKQRIGG